MGFFTWKFGMKSNHATLSLLKFIVILEAFCFVYSLLPKETKLLKCRGPPYEGLMCTIKQKAEQFTNATLTAINEMCLWYASWGGHWATEIFNSYRLILPATQTVWPSPNFCHVLTHTVYLGMTDGGRRDQKFPYDHPDNFWQRTYSTPTTETLSC